MEPRGFGILHEEGPCLVLAKPAGLLTQAPPGIDSLETRVRRFLQEREGKSHALYLGLPHRLDRPVSGAIVMARHVRAARRISEQFERRTVDKTYWALVEGRVEAPDGGDSAVQPIASSPLVADTHDVRTEAWGTWIDWMRKVPEQARSETVAADHPDAQQAILHYRVVARRESATWLEIRLETGRTHQIRVQCAARGHAVLGDTLYGATTSFGPATDDVRERWIALHARWLAFEHPMTRAKLSIEAPVDPGWHLEGFRTQPDAQAR